MQLLELDFGLFLLHEDYIIGEINEGVHIDLEKNAAILDFVQRYYPDKPVGYISKRINDYKVDPKIHFANREQNSILSFAVVDNNLGNQLEYELETKFLDPNRVRFFNKTGPAIDWVRATTINR